FSDAGCELVALSSSESLFILEICRTDTLQRLRCEVIRSVSETRGFAIPTRESFLREVGPQGALYVGSPETVAQKIAANIPALGATRFDLKYGMGGLSHQALMTNIELYGTQVVPRVRELLV
ncbi:MAG TPA: hypothetical protein VF221_04515, partial [Chloroflexota bacterium]